MKKINKILLVITILLITVGCGNMNSTPTKKVETLLSKYQTQDKEVLDQLDNVVEESGALTETQKEKYRDLMKKQYQNLNYKIKSETEDGTMATVIVEIQVLDYGKALSNAENYLMNNRSEFITTENEEDIDNIKYMDYKIKSMTDTTDKVTYTINFNLIKEDDEWKLNDLSDIDRLKLHGLYY